MKKYSNWNIENVSKDNYFKLILGALKRSQLFDMKSIQIFENSLIANMSINKNKYINFFTDGKYFYYTFLGETKRRKNLYYLLKLFVKRIKELKTKLYKLLSKGLIQELEDYLYKEFNLISIDNKNNSTKDNISIRLHKLIHIEGNFYKNIVRIRISEKLNNNKFKKDFFEIFTKYFYFFRHKKLIFSIVKKDEYLSTFLTINMQNSLKDYKKLLTLI